MFRVLLIGFHNSGTYGHRCLSAALKADGVEVSNVFFQRNVIYRVAQPFTRAEMQALVDLVQQISPELIGLNVAASFAHSIVQTVVAQLKEHITAPVILGGVHPTLLPEYCLETTLADYVCVGEGEEMVTELCRRLQSGGDLTDIPGLMTRTTRTFSPRRPPQDLDRLPFQDVGHANKYSILPDGRAEEGDPLLRSLAYETKCSRGCPFHCSFCSVATLTELYRPARYYRRRSAENVVQELRRYLELNPNCNYIRFWDDTFPSSRKWVEDFTERYRREIGLPFGIWLNPNTTFERNIALLKTAGLKQVVIGIESASDQTRKNVYLRSETRQDILNADQVLTQHGVRKVYDLILDHPWESPKELPDTFDLAMQLKKPYEFNMHSLVLLPYTTLADRAIQEGYIVDQPQVITALTADGEASKRIQWASGALPQANDERNYWLFLILCAAHPDIPRWFTRFLANFGLFKKYPSLLTDQALTGISQVHETGEESLSPLRTAYTRSPLKRTLDRAPGLKRQIKALDRKLSDLKRPAIFLAGISLRIITTFPHLVCRRGIT